MLSYGYVWKRHWGEKKPRINEMAAYYLAGAVVFFTYSALLRACYQKCVLGAYCMNPLCMHFMHILENITLCFPLLHFVQWSSNIFVMSTRLIESFLCFSCCQIRKILQRGGVDTVSAHSPFHTHAHTHAHTGGYTVTSIGSPAYLLSVCLQATDRVALFIREWDSWFPWLCPINTFLSVLLEASNKSRVFDWVDKRATCPRGSRRGSVTHSCRG